MQFIRVAIADDHQVIRLGLRCLLEDEPDIQVVGEAASARATLELVKRERPNVTILDLHMPDGSGLSIVPELRRACPDTRVLVLTMHIEPDIVRQALAAGVHGYINKTAHCDELVGAVRSIAAGRSFLSVPLAQSGMEDLIGGGAEPPAAPVQAPRSLSGREKQVLTLFARGLTQREIAGALGLRVKTVETYRTRLGSKFGARTRAELVRCARALGLVSGDSG